MAKRCICTIGWVTDPDGIGTAEMFGIGCEEYRAILWKLVNEGTHPRSLTPRENKILRKAMEEGWG